MNLSINGQSQVPPGFRFHPTEEELLHYYLRKKVAYQKIDLDVIREVDLNKLEPWDIQEKCKIGSTPQNDWYFFSHKDKKYPTGTRTNRATAAGFWKATGRDKIIYSGLKRIGSRKTLVFYKGRAPHGQKSDWIMHEYRLDDTSQETCVASNYMMELVQEEGWVVCRVFKKKNHRKSLGSPKGSSKSLDSKTNHILGSGNDGVLDQILLHMGRTCKTESESLTQMNQNTDTDTSRFLSTFNNEGIINERFSHLPRLISPTLPRFQLDQNLNILENNNIIQGPGKCSLVQENTKSGPSDWATFDRLVASQLNGQAADTSKQLLCLESEPNETFGSTNEQPQLYINDNDLWSSFTKSSSSPSSSDPLCHLSV